MNRRGVAVLFLLAAVRLPTSGDEPLRFRYDSGEILVYEERIHDTETHDPIGFAIETAHVVRRTYRILTVDEAGNAEVLVEEESGPRELLVYRERGEDARARHLRRFDPDVTVSHRVMTTRFTPERFRTEPSRDEPVVYYLQEIPETLRRLCTLPEGDGRLDLEESLSRLAFTLRYGPPETVDSDGRSLRRFEGELAMTARDIRLQDGADVPFPAGGVRLDVDPERGIPVAWEAIQRYTRHPVNRPNVRSVTGRLVEEGRIDAEELAGLREEAADFTAIRDAFHEGRFEAGLTAAERFRIARPDGQLAGAARAHVAAFREEVPLYGEAPPPLAATDWFNGGPHDWDSLRGKVVVLDFWATWCVPCIAGMEHLIDLQAKYGDRVVVIGATKLDRRQTTASVRTFVEERYAAGHEGRELNYPFAIVDPSMHEALGVGAIPHLFAIDRQGRIRWSHVGSGDAARLDRIVASLLED